MNLPGHMQQHWSRLAERERWLIGLAAVLVLLALLWGLGIAPAARALQSAPVRLAQLDRQLQSMELLAAQARELQTRPVVRRDEALRAVQSSLQQRLGGQAQISNAGDRVTVTLTGVSSPALAQWLGQARSAARVVVAQARLTRSPSGWNGSIVLQLPAE